MIRAPPARSAPEGLKSPSRTVSERKSTERRPRVEAVRRVRPPPRAAAAVELGIQAPHVHPALNRLMDAGVRQRKSEHGFGGPLYRADDVLESLDAFAERVGRREKIQRKGK